jgi:hypothetical protein
MEKREQIIDLLNKCIIGESVANTADRILDLFSVMPSLNIDIRPKARKHLKGYYGSNDSRAFEETHIDHYTQGYKQAEKDIMNKHNEA